MSQIGDSNKKTTQDDFDEDSKLHKNKFKYDNSTGSFIFDTSVQLPENDKVYEVLTK